MTRGDGTTYDTDAHVEWGYVLDDWPKNGVTSFIAMDSEAEARRYCGLAPRSARRLAKRTIGHAEEIENNG